MKPGVLLVDDEPATLFGYSRYLKKVGYDVAEAASLQKALKELRGRKFDAVILDMVLPDGNGIDIIEHARGLYPSIAVIMVTGKGDIPLAVEAMKRGADNFLTKPVNMEELEVFLRKSLEVGSLRRMEQARRMLSEKAGEPYFGESAAMADVLEQARIAADNDSPVLLLGETGVGKGVLAKWIHGHGPRNKMPFVEVNCSALRGELLVSELFGHTRGAFTSAVADRQGLVDAADQGTLLLDEIGDMDIAVQAQFLKVIEEKSYRRLGEVALRSSDFRLICATNKDLQEEGGQGGFRRDLFFRINVFPIHIPPLRNRPGDLPGFFRHILGSMGAVDTELSPEAMQLLLGYSWPGNIREACNLIERAVLISRGGTLTPEHFPGLQPAGVKAAEQKTSPESLVDVQRDFILDAVQRCGGDVAEAAKSIGMSRASLYRKLKKFRQQQ